MLLHQDRRAKKQAARGKFRPAFLLPDAPHQTQTGRHKKGAEMRRVAGQSEHGRTGGEQGVTGRRHDAGGLIQDFFPEPEKHQRGRRRHQQNTKMDSRRRFAEQRHDGGVGEISSRKFHVVGQFVGRNAVQNQLPGVGIFALVAFQRKIQQPQPRDGDDDAAPRP